MGKDYMNTQRQGVEEMLKGGYNLSACLGPRDADPRQRGRTHIAPTSLDFSTPCANSAPPVRPVQTSSRRSLIICSLFQCRQGTENNYYFQGATMQRNYQSRCQCPSGTWSRLRSSTATWGKNETMIVVGPLKLDADCQGRFGRCARIRRYVVCMVHPTSSQRTKDHLASCLSPSMGRSLQTDGQQ